ncbi:Clavaminate synthase-like protein, partial [Aaosphaeria arxii CBS 175.79]
MIDSLKVNVLATSHKILDTILRYRSPLPKGAVDCSDEGALKFLGMIYLAVKADQPVPMVMPAFPFKSPNAKDKVLGISPDKGEDVALAHLNGLCAAIKDIYEPGAILTIVSDGLVYNDLLGVPDHVVWNYGRKLRELAASRGYKHIQFAQLRNLLALKSIDEQLDDMSYAAAASFMRLSLMNQFGATSWAEGSDLEVDDNKRTTYCGYLKFLELDLATTYPIDEERTKSRFKKGVAKIAKAMLKRGDAFARAVRSRFPDHVRLSIHPSNGKDKISVNVLPVATTVTPWHCSIAFKVDGTLLAGHRTTFEAMDDMELVYENKQPSYFREKSSLYSWQSTPVTFEPLYPCGILVRPANGPKSASIDDVDALKIRELAELNSPVVLRGFTKTRDRERFVAKSYDFGKPTPWKFGLVLEVKDQGAETEGLNNVLSSEWMPFHFDGMFKTQKHVRDDGSYDLVPQPPRFQFFTAVTSSPKDTGYTLFSASRLVFQYLPKHISVDQLRSLTYSVSTPSFDQAIIRRLPLIQQHPSTDQPCIRYHERWPQEKTKFDPTHVEIENGDQEICDILESLLHDRRVCNWHMWVKGDLLVSDNISTMHTRSSFLAQVDRELWRIHFD